METSDLRNKFLFFIIFVAIVTLVLIAFPFVELPVKEYVSNFFGRTDARMGETAAVLVDQLFAF